MPLKSIEELREEGLEKKRRLEADYADCVVTLPINQKMFDTWEDPTHPILVLPDGFRDDTMHQTADASPWSFHSFYEKFPRITHPNFAGMQRRVDIYEQQLIGDLAPSMRFILDPHVPSVQYLSSDPKSLTFILNACRALLEEEKQRIQRFQSLITGNIPIGMDATNACKAFLTTLRESLANCTVTDMEYIDFAIMHATEEALLHHGVEAEVEAYINHYAPLPAATNRIFHAAQIVRRALCNPKLQRKTQANLGN